MELPFSIYFAGIVAIGMLVWDTIEVGRNDAANIINAVFGARVLRRKVAIRIAAVAVIFGAWAASPVIETTRKGIFDPLSITLAQAMTVYIAVYLSDTLILFSFSSFGMPISTTACMVFELLGASFAIGGAGIIDWTKSSHVVIAIFASIITSGMVSFFVQRAFRGAIGQNCQDQKKVILHGPWISGALLTGLVYFILMKGMKNVEFIQLIKNNTLDELGTPVVLIFLWCALSVLTWLIMRVWGSVIHRNLFAYLSIFGMIAIAFAFGQNDLGTCASPGVAAYMILKYKTIAATKDIPSYILLICGCFLAIGMSTKTAQRVTRAQVNTGSQGDIVRLYAPKWCIWIAKKIAPKQPDTEVLAPETHIEPHKKIEHYDALRAAVITSISASVIAFASGLGFPVSTTYVSFSAIVATGWADRIFSRGDSHLKIGRTIWVVFCWFFSAFIGATTAGFFATTISYTGPAGITIILIANILIRRYIKKRSAEQDKRLYEEAAERKRQMYQHDHPYAALKDASDFDEEETS